MNNYLILTILATFGTVAIGIFGQIYRLKNKNNDLTVSGRLFIGGVLFFGVLTTILQVTSRQKDNEEFEKNYKLSINTLDTVQKNFWVALDILQDTDTLKKTIKKQKNIIDSLESKLIENQNELKIKSNEIIALQDKLLNNSTETINQITGGNSFCYFYAYPYPSIEKEISSEWEIHFFLKVKGDYSVRNIKFVICDAIEEIVDKSGNHCFEGEKDFIAGNKDRKPNINAPTWIEPIDVTKKDLIYRVNIEANGKLFFQEIRIVWDDLVGWKEAYVVKGEYNHNTLLVYKHPEFPELKGGKPDMGHEKIRHLRRKNW